MLDRRGKRMNIPGTRAGFWFALALGVVIGAALGVLFMPRSGGAVVGDQRDIGDTTLRRRSQERLGPWVERVRERYSEAIAVGRDYYERTIDEAKRGLASAKSGEFHS
jgi:hypothetical protein